MSGFAVVTDSSKLSGPQPASATEIAALSWPKAQYEKNERKKAATMVFIALRISHETTRGCYPCSIRRGAVVWRSKKVRLCRPDRADRPG